MNSRETVFGYLVFAGLLFLFINIFYAVAHHYNPLPDYNNHQEVLEENLPILWRIELIFYALPCIVAIILDGGIGGLFFFTFFEYIVFLPLILEFFPSYATNLAVLAFSVNTFLLIVYKFIIRKIKKDYSVQHTKNLIRTFWRKGLKIYKLPLELKEFYETVRNKYIRYYSEGEALKTLIHHDIGHPINVEEEKEYFKKYGKWSFDDARKILESFVYNCIEGTEDAESRIAKIIKCMSEYLEYKHHFKFNYYFPLEIFDHGEGTCVDWTIFFIACLKILGIKAAFGIFKNDKDEYHAMALVGISDIGYPHYYYRDLSDEMRGKWIIIDPQLPLNKQKSQWIEQWKLLKAYPI